MAHFLIIGGSSGIGKAIVETLSQNGHSILATYNTTEPEISLNQVHFKKVDMMYESLDPSWLPQQLDGLVYCPGSINLKPFTSFKEEDFVDDYRLQVVGATKVIKQTLPLLKSSHNGSIVLFSTVAVQLGFSFHAQVAASKGAIEGLTKALAAEFAPKVRVNCIAPSLTKTPLASRLLNTSEKVSAMADKNPLKRIGDPSDIAKATAYLLSEDSSYINGQILHVDGGYSAIK